jgi:hypothetical protein
MTRMRAAELLGLRLRLALLCRRGVRSEVCFAHGIYRARIFLEDARQFDNAAFRHLPPIHWQSRLLSKEISCSRKKGITWLEGLSVWKTAI